MEEWKCFLTARICTDKISRKYFRFANIITARDFDVYHLEEGIVLRPREALSRGQPCVESCPCRSCVVIVAPPSVL